MRAGIVLDRDGTLIDFYRDSTRGVVTPAFHPDHVRLLPGVVEGLVLLRDAGYALAIATNQPDAAKGRLSREAIADTNAALVERLTAAGIIIERLEACLHHPERHDGGDRSLEISCGCRKPKPGMLDTIVEQLGLDRERSWMIGDTASDLGAARAAGLRCGLLMQTSRCELCVFGQVSFDGAEPELRASRLDTLAQAIVELHGDPA